MNIQKVWARPAVRYVGAIVLLLAAPRHALLAQSADDTFEVSITITDSCTITADDLNFGVRASVASPVNATSSITVNCSNSTAYTVGLDQGENGNRLMTNGSDDIDYDLYTTVGHETAWGTDPGVNTVGGTGDGTNQILTVYGQVPGQTTPGPGIYSDTVTATIAF